MNYKFLINEGTGYKTRHHFSLFHFIPLIWVILGIALIIYFDHLKMGAGISLVSLLFFLIIMSKKSNLRIYPQDRLIRVNRDRYAMGPDLYSFSDLEEFELETLYLLRIPINTTLYARFRLEDRCYRRTVTMSFYRTNILFLLEELEAVVKVGCSIVDKPEGE
ncbi:hypothetical protein [Sphingobacterium sp. BN32]|uniref:hypothetical protein n=1 Tax=Sphingobacterium sp. BN32 TaxID=3058432 RepID=UPI00265D4FD1|nr:hypothetical protein [Sphingobacterium sp. BN32]WKK58541.1 hypothetical protein QYC40_18120 [Sphingobacterium sp. BN32]